MNSPQNSIDTIQEMMIPCVPEKSGIIPALPREMFMDKSLIRRIEINRDETRRLKKVNFLRTHIPSHDEISLFIIPKPFTIELEKGESLRVEPGVELSNGNTRREFYTQNPECLPSTDLVANVYYIRTAEEYKKMYYSYDSQDSVEATSDKIQGALSLLNVNVTSTVAKGGNYATALKIAYGDSKANALTLVSSFKKEIELLDKVGMFSPQDKSLSFQTMYALGLVAAKYWGEPNSSYERMVSGLQSLATFRSDDANWSGSNWDGITAICREVSMGDKGWIPEGLLKKTNYAAIAPQMDFMLYCFEKYMTSQKLDKTRGFKPAFWEGKYGEILSQF